MECKDLALDLMHLSTDEAGEIKDSSGLKVHLKECLACQQKLSELRGAHLFSVLARPRSAKYQQKMKALLEKVKAEATKVVPETRPEATVGVKMVQGRPVLDNETEVGTVAGAAWRYLGDKEWVDLNRLSRDLERKDGFHPNKTKLAVGWLILQNKVYYTEEKQDAFVYLNEQEREIWQQEQGRV